MIRGLFSFAALSFSVHVVDHIVAGQEIDPLFAGALALAVFMVAGSLLSLPERTLRVGGAAAGAVILAGSIPFHLVPLLTAGSGGGSDPTGVSGLIASAGAALLTVVSVASPGDGSVRMNIPARRRYVR